MTKYGSPGFIHGSWFGEMKEREREERMRERI
jgi:hypothetical protein